MGVMSSAPSSTPGRSPPPPLLCYPPLGLLSLCPWLQPPVCKCNALYNWGSSPWPPLLYSTHWSENVAAKMVLTEHICSTCCNRVAGYVEFGGSVLANVIPNVSMQKKAKQVELKRKFVSTSSSFVTLWGSLMTTPGRG